MDWFAQSFGIIGGALFIASYQFRSNRVIFALQTASALVFSVNYALLGGWVGMALNLLAVTRGVFLVLPDGKGVRPATFWLIIGLTLATSGVLFGTGQMFRVVDFLLPLQFVISTVICWRQDGRLLRIGQLFIISPCMLAYNITVFTLGGIVTECCNMLSTIVSVVRFGWNGFDRQAGAAQQQKSAS